MRSARLAVLRASRRLVAAGRAWRPAGARRGRPWSRGRCASRWRDPASRGRYANALWGARRLPVAARRARCGCRTGRRRTRARCPGSRRRPVASRGLRRRGVRAAPRALAASRSRSAGCAFVAGRERIGDADVQLLRAAREPAAAAGRESGGLLELGRPSSAAVERASASSQPARRATWHVSRCRRSRRRSCSASPPRENDERPPRRDVRGPYEVPRTGFEPVLPA